MTRYIETFYQSRYVTSRSRFITWFCCCGWSAQSWSILSWLGLFFWEALLAGYCVVILDLCA